MSQQLTTDDWYELRLKWKAHADKRIASEVESAINMCMIRGIDMKEFNTNSFRFSREGNETVDWYPRSRRIFIHSKKKWSKHNRVDQLIRYYYK